MAGPVMLFLLLTSEGAFAETLQGAVAAPQGAPSEAPPQGGATTAPPPASQPLSKAPPYSLPWQLRPVTAGTVIRSDSSFAGYEDAGSHPGTTSVTTLLASYKIPGTGGVGSGLAPMLRLGFVNDSPPAGAGGLTFMNPLVGATYALKLPEGFRISFFFAVTVPIGGGGGDTPAPGNANSRAKGIFARASMDNAMFAVNDFTLIPGLDLAYVGHGFTFQAEVTLLELLRVRGDKVQAEASKTNLTTGVHLGYFFTDTLSFGADLRYQLWLSAPAAVEKLRASTNDAVMDNASVAVGPRVHIKVGEASWIRPGLSYGRGLDKPTGLAGSNYQFVQLDVPFQF